MSNAPDQLPSVRVTDVTTAPALTNGASTLMPSVISSRQSPSQSHRHDGGPRVHERRLHAHAISDQFPSDRVTDVTTSPALTNGASKPSTNSTSSASATPNALRSTGPY